MANLTSRLLAIAAVLLAAGVAPAQDPPAQVVTLTCRTPSVRGRLITLRLDGTASVPDETILKVALRVQFEGATGVKFVPLTNDNDVFNPQAEVKNRKFHIEQQVDVPGIYVASVEIQDALQPKQAIVAALRKANLPSRKFDFKFNVWTDDLMAQASSKLDEMTALADTALDLVTRIEKACDSPAAWAAAGKGLLKEADDLATKLDKHSDRTRNPNLWALPNLFAASFEAIRESVRDVQKHGQYFIFVNGKWDRAKDYHEEDEKAKTFRKETFHFGALKKYLEQAPWLSGRELVLWAIKDLRRMSGSQSGALTDALKSNAARPGVSELAERLQKATVEELDALENEARIIFEFKKGK